MARRVFRDFPVSDVQEFPWMMAMGWIAVVVLATAVLYIIFDGFYTVDAHERAVVLRFGKFRPPIVEPGLRFKIPVVDEVIKVSVAENSLRLPFGQPQRGEAAEEESTLMLTGDLNAASVEWTIQWKVESPEKFVFRFYQPNDPQYAERVIRAVAESVMNRLVGDYSIDEVLTEKRSEIAHMAREATQQILDSYDCGVVIRDLQMQRVRPPERVRPAFEEVNASLQKREQLENEAKKERNERLPIALAERDKLIREAEGYAQRRRAEAQGEIAALLAQYRQYQKAPEETRRRLYLETMEEVLSRVQVQIVVDENLRQAVLPLLSLPTDTKSN
ncbi:MAG: FtsH protease activity modulator HflK [Thermoguttaceae bacterium]|nr:FtsH protease activity modulator HflK [Thermoguttaceae bacterium]MDW8079881.1 FtsH protease activity modulator HflK [Thermoguttaceae bacterium]